VLALDTRSPWNLAMWGSRNCSVSGVNRCTPELGSDWINAADSSESTFVKSALRDMAGREGPVAASS
jgi:hypothetical protein